MDGSGYPRIFTNEDSRITGVSWGYSALSPSCPSGWQLHIGASSKQNKWCQSVECWGGAPTGRVASSNGFSPLPPTWTQSIHVIPASFSIQLKQDKSDLDFNMKRRLLNTEKLIFKEPGHKEVYVLVNVEPAGVVAKPHVQERQTVIFNIVCDELSLGIPHKAWWVGMLAFLCLGIALIIPYFLPSHLLPRRIQDCYEPALSKGA